MKINKKLLFIVIYKKFSLRFIYDIDEKISSIIIENEANGISSSILKTINHKSKLPMYDKKHP